LVIISLVFMSRCAAGCIDTPAVGRLLARVSEMIGL